MTKKNKEQYKLLQLERVWALTRLINEKDSLAHLMLIEKISKACEEMDKLAGVK